MSMHLRGSSDMMANEEGGWWSARTGLEQKLIILSTLLFILSFALVITVIVLKNRDVPSTGGTTVAPTTVNTGSTESTVSTVSTVSEGTTVSGQTEPSTEATTPTTQKKPDEKNPDENKPDEKKPDENKPDEKKPDENKPDEKNPEEPKTAFAPLIQNSSGSKLKLLSPILKQRMLMDIRA